MKRLDQLEHQVHSRFLHGSSAPSASARLFCFPFAGGSAAVFAAWGGELKPGIEVWAAQPRGRGTRLYEPPHRSVKEMAEDYLEAIRAHLDLPFAFYGHSLGGLLAFELTLQLEAAGLAQPRRLFIGACLPPGLGLLHSRISHLPDDGFVAAVRERYAGIPEAVLREPELMQLFLPGLKADFAAHESFDRSRIAQVHCPVTALAGDGDPVIEPVKMREWGRHTAASFDHCIIPGDHFFLSASRDAVLSRVREKMGSDLAQDRSLSVSGFAAP
jgi:medium-chain acyl-[acyl-carrier-protein] hydrolase